MKENLKVIGFVLAVVLAVVAFSAGSRWLLDNLPQQTPALTNTDESCLQEPTAASTPTTTLTPAVIDQSAITVEQGVETLFTVNAGEDMYMWVYRLCELSPDACNLRWTWMPVMEEKMAQYPGASQTCEASALRLIKSEIETAISQSQCWVVEYTISGWGETETQLIWACTEYWPETGKYEFTGADTNYPQSILQDLLENGIETPVPQK